MNHDLPPDDAPPEREDLKSKSQLKREMHALQALGEELVHLSREQLSRIPLSESLTEAITHMRQLSRHGARKRQMQYIGRLMRDVDAVEVRARIDRVTGRSPLAAAALQQSERWRDRLLEEGDKGLEALFNAHPSADRQRLRQVLRNARKELQTNKPPKSTRTLFECLRELMDQA